MLHRSPLLNRIVTLLIVYMLVIGATFEGLLYPQIKLLSLTFVAGVVVCWLFYRQRENWQWHTSVLDGVFVLWTIVFVVSLAANIEDWRRISLGLWHVSFYIAVWLTLSDMLSNKAVSRDEIITALLSGGVLVLFAGYVQICTWLGQWLTFFSSDTVIANVPRPTGTLTNTNFLGGFLAVLVPFILTRIISTPKSHLRFLWVLYLTATLVLLLITASRGSWFALLTSFPVWLLLILNQYNLLSWSRLKSWWQAQASERRLLTGTITLIAAAVLVLVGGLFLTLLVSRGWNGRETIYDAAWSTFIQKPLTGFGLFTFDHSFAGVASFPPDAPHAHAHNGLLQVASELGIFGLFAVAITTWIVGRAIRQNWKFGTERLILAAAIASTIGVIAHHMTDFTGLMPAIALTFLCVLCVACVPLETLPITGIAQRVRLPFVVGLWVFLLGVGFWSTKIYIDFLDVFDTVYETQNYRAAGDNLAVIVAADPLPTYIVDQALLYGMAANEGDLEAARLSANAYTNYLGIQPNYAFAWINLAALHWQLDETDAAITSAREAVRRAPDAAPYWMLLGRYLELSGNLDDARDAYSQALMNDADIMLLPEWNATPLQQEFAQREPSPRHLAFILLRDRQVDAALIAWENDTTGNSQSLGAVVQALAAGAQGNYADATSWLERAQFLSVGRDDNAWIHLGSAWIANWQGDSSAFEAEIAASCDSLTEAELMPGSYWQWGEIIHRQYMRIGVLRLHLPQTDFPRYSPLLWSLLNCP